MVDGGVLQVNRWQLPLDFTTASVHLTTLIGSSNGTYAFSPTTCGQTLQPSSRKLGRRSSRGLLPIQGSPCTLFCSSEIGRRVMISTPCWQLSRSMSISTLLPSLSRSASMFSVIRRPHEPGQRRCVPMSSPTEVAHIPCWLSRELSLCGMVCPARSCIKGKPP